jgi:hypothetical protein
MNQPIVGSVLSITARNSPGLRPAHRVVRANAVSARDERSPQPPMRAARSDVWRKEGSRRPTIHQQPGHRMGRAVAACSACHSGHASRRPALAAALHRHIYHSNYTVSMRNKKYAARAPFGCHDARAEVAHSIGSVPVRTREPVSASENIGICTVRTIFRALSINLAHIGPGVGPAQLVRCGIAAGHAQGVIAQRFRHLGASGRFLGKQGAAAHRLMRIPLVE